MTKAKKDFAVCPQRGFKTLLGGLVENANTLLATGPILPIVYLFAPIIGGAVAAEYSPAIDTTELDPNVHPQDDFRGYVNGQLFARTGIHGQAELGRLHHAGGGIL